MNNNINHNEYSVLAFPNGRVVLYKNELLNEAVENDKELLFICNAWSGGHAYAVGADKHEDMIDGEMRECYDMYTRDVVDVAFDEEALKKFYRVIFTGGNQIIMETGEQANRYNVFCNKFADWDSVDDEDLNDGENYKIRVTIDEVATASRIKDKEKDWGKKVWALWGVGIVNDETMKYFGLM